MYFSKLIPVGNLDETIVVDEDNGEVYLHCVDGRIPENIPNELIDSELGLIYSIDVTARDFCNVTTWKYPLKYLYEKESFGFMFDNCNVMEYSSPTLTDFMCKYMEEESEKSVTFQQKFAIEDICIEFYGHKVHIDQMPYECENADPSIRIYFPKEKTIEEKMKYISMIDSMLQIFSFSKCILKPFIKFTTTEFKDFVKLTIYDSKKYCTNEVTGYKIKLSDRYDRVKDCIPCIFEWLLKNLVDTSYFTYVWSIENLDMQKIFSDTYFVFDKLANKMYGKEKVNLEFEKFKKSIWTQIEKSPEYEQVKDYVGNLKDKIMSHGRESGHKTKLLKAFREVGSWIPNRVYAYDISEAKVNEIYKIRTEIVHKGEIIDFRNEKWQYVEILQWITLALQLRQMGIPVEKMEDILNMIFGVG